MSALASARPPETTLAAVCRSGRSERADDTEMKRVWVAGTAATLTASMGAGTTATPAASKEAIRTVAMIFVPAATSTVVMALLA